MSQQVPTEIVLKSLTHDPYAHSRRERHSKVAVRIVVGSVIAFWALLFAVLLR